MHPMPLRVRALMWVKLHKSRVRCHIQPLPVCDATIASALLAR
jgi:hypothetical protein